MKQRGDTIIEVLLAMSIIGMVLGASFGIANRSLAIGRAAQERTEALKVAESQLEVLKQLVDDESHPGENFCMGVDDNIPGEFKYKVVDSALDLNSTCREIDGSLYSVVIKSLNPAVTEDRVYVITVTWERIGTASDYPGEVTIHYRLGAL